MSYITRSEEKKRDERYLELIRGAQRLTTRTTTWMTEATNLHTDSVSPEEKADVIVLRDGLVSDLRTILGV